MQTEDGAMSHQPGSGAGRQKAPADDVTTASSIITESADKLWQIRGHVVQPEKRVPVVKDVDVVVAGGGIAGIIAALAATRFGAKTLIIEAFPSLGGNMGVGMFCGGGLHLALHNPEAFPNGLGGIPEQYNSRVVGGEDRAVGSDYFRDSQAVSYVTSRMMEEAGIEQLLSSVVSGAIKEGNKVRGVFVENKCGTLAIRSKVVIDCTGTADVADRAGAEVIELPLNPSAGTFFAIAEVEWQRYQEALESYGVGTEEDRAWLHANLPEMYRAGVKPFMPWAREAWEAGEFRIVETVDGFASLEITMKGPSRTPFVRFRTRVNGRFHPGDGLALSRIDQKMRAYIYEFAAFMRKRVPGFENSYLLLISPFTHPRGGKSVVSERIVTVEDVQNSARFDDVALIFYDDKKYYPGGCDVPYRALVPKDVDGLLAAGKSAVKRGPQMRVRHVVQLMGQAAGVAAALAVKHGVEPRHVDVKELQKILHELGADLGPQERLEELGLV